MKFVYIDSEGNQVGPVDQKTIERGIEDGVITEETAIRNALLKEYRTIKDFPGFKETIARVEKMRDPDGSLAAAKAAAAELKGWDLVFAAAKHDDTQEQSSALSQTAQPKNVGIVRRISAVVLDALFLWVIAGVIFGLAFLMASRKGYIQMTAPDTGGFKINLPQSSEPESEAVEGVEEAEAAAESRSTADNPIRTAIPALDRVMKRGEAHNAEIEAELGQTPTSVPAASAPAEGDAPAAPELPATPEELTDPELVETQFSMWEFMVIDSKGYHRVLLGACWLFIPLVILYYSLALSIYAQTIGMWYFGMFLTRKDIEEVYFLRAFLYTIALLLFGIVMIPMVIVSGRSLADWICGVRVINVFSTPAS